MILSQCVFVSIQVNMGLTLSKLSIQNPFREFIGND